jgi:hypothetical protein
VTIVEAGHKYNSLAPWRIHRPQDRASAEPLNGESEK